MPKAAIIVLADTETHGDLGRVVNALEAVKELKEAGDEVKLIFDGAGTQWIPKLSEKAHRLTACSCPWRIELPGRARTALAPSRPRKG